MLTAESKINISTSHFSSLDINGMTLIILRHSFSAASVKEGFSPGMCHANSRRNESSEIYPHCIFSICGAFVTRRVTDYWGQAGFGHSVNREYP